MFTLSSAPLKFLVDSPNSYPEIAQVLHILHGGTFGIVRDMRRTIRKGCSHVHVTYQNRSYSNNLYAEKTATVILTSKNSEKDWANVKFFQIFEERLCREIRDATKSMKPMPWVVEIRFKDGEVHILPVSIRGSGDIVQMNVIQEENAKA